MDSQLWAALLGAVVGGVLAAGVQELSLRRQRAGRLGDLRVTILLKLVQMQADHAASLLLLEEGLAFSRSRGMAPSQGTKPAVNHPEVIEITADEMHATMQTKDSDLLRRMLTVSRRHGTMIALGKKYSDVRDKMTDISRAVPEGLDHIGVVMLRGAEATQYAVLAHEGTQLLEHSYAICTEQTEELRWMIRALNAHTIRLGDSDLVLRANDQPSGQPSRPTARRGARSPNCCAVRFR